MAFDYILWRDCVLQEGRHPKAVIDDAKLRDVLNFAQSNQDTILAQNPGKSIDEVIISRQAADGEVCEVSIGEIRQNWERLLEQAQHACPDCPLNFRERAMGCTGAITYPIPASFERWAIDHFNPPVHSESGILGFIHDYGAEITGEQVDAARPTEPGERALLESVQPFTRTLTHGRPIRLINYPAPDPSLSSSQLVELLLSSQTPGPLLLWSFCLEFGAIEAAPSDCERVNQLLMPGFEDLLPKIEGEGLEFMTVHEPGNTLMGKRCGPFDEDGAQEFQNIVRRSRFVLKHEDDDDEGAWRFKQFLHACWACLLSGMGRMVTDA